MPPSKEGGGEAAARSGQIDSREAWQPGGSWAPSQRQPRSAPAWRTAWWLSLHCRGSLAVAAFPPPPPHHAAVAARCCHLLLLAGRRQAGRPLLLPLLPHSGLPSAPPLRGALPAPGALCLQMETREEVQCRGAGLRTVCMYVYMCVCATGGMPAVMKGSKQVAAYSSVASLAHHQPSHH